MMNRRNFMLTAAGLALAGTFAVAPANADFYDYLARPEPEYKWSLTEKRDLPAGTIYDMKMTSQVWQNIKWDHRVQLFVPKEVKRPGYCTMLNTGGNGSKENDLIALTVAASTGAPFAIIHNIPNQPLYNGLTEDALIAYTWVKFIETGDETWPLHFPMAKAVIKAMDTVQSLTKQESLPALDRFVITGASKRGWTTWLVGASGDKRVAGIAPMVIDILNVKAQLAHQLEHYGKPSEQVEDYSAVGFDKILSGPKGERLMQLEDPYSYRAKLTMPKMILLGTNDRYWSQDSLNLYWDGLVGEKSVLYAPNSGHGLEDRGRVLATLSAFARSVAEKKPMPALRWTRKELANGSCDFVVTSNTPIVSARIFRCEAPTRDYRDSKWSSIELTVPAGGKSVKANAPKPATGCAASYVEVTYGAGAEKFTLTTQMQLLGKPVSAPK
jgi:PhoPQ-activated pathogenicity-related protein